jgi:hypothetical protein
MKHIQLFENYSSNPYKTDEDIDRDFDMLIAKAEKDEEGELKGEEFSNILKFFMDKLPEGVPGRMRVIRHVVNRLNYEHSLNFKEHEFARFGEERDPIWRNWKPGTKNLQQRIKALQMVVDFHKDAAPEWPNSGGRGNASLYRDPQYVKATDQKYKAYLK